ncbi:MAG: hypothetical protein WCK34_15590 [Bacteroidota bacterium]
MALSLPGFTNSPLLLLWILSVIAGILLLYIVLSRFFKTPVILFTASLLIFGTNYFQQTFLAGPVASAFLFPLFLAIILLTLEWQRVRGLALLLLMIPVMTAIAFLSAPGTMVILFPIMAVMQEGDTEEGIKFTVKGRVGLILFLTVLVTSCFILRQFSWFSDPGGRFYYGDVAGANFPIVPANIHRVLFSFRNGWVIYSPLVVAAFAGYYFLAEKNKTIFIPAFLFLLVSMVWAASSPDWWFAGAFGYPRLVETYAILCIPLGYFTRWALDHGRPVRVIVLLVAAILISLNLFQTWQFTRKIIFPQRMNLAYYRASFGKTTVSQGRQRLMEPPGPGISDSMPVEIRMQCCRVANFDFEQRMAGYEPFQLTRAARSGNFGLALNNRLRYSPALERPVKQLTSRDSCWISATCFFFFDCRNADNRVFLVITCIHRGIPYKYRTTDLTAGRFHAGIWNRAEMTYLLPFTTEPDDLLEVYMMNYGEQECLIDDFEINLCNPAPQP